MLKALLTQQALDKPYPDKFRVIKQKSNSLLCQTNEKEIPTHLCSISSLTIIFFSLQAGKHRLFLNILLFWKLPVPTWIRSAWIHTAGFPILPVTSLSLFLNDLNFYRIFIGYLLCLFIYIIRTAALFFHQMPLEICQLKLTSTVFGHFMWISRTTVGTHILSILSQRAPVGCTASGCCSYFGRCCCK